MDHTVELVKSSAEELPPISDPKFGEKFDRFGAGKLVLIGDASHGTSEFYRGRCEITKRLIQQHDFKIVAIEADWPSAYQLNKYVQGRQIKGRPFDGFKCFPEWMWRNEEMRSFVEWLRERNSKVPAEEKVGIYGLDLYSLETSIQAVLMYLDQVDPEMAELARKRYGCLQPWVEDPSQYGLVAYKRGRAPCEEKVIQMLMDLMQKRLEYAKQNQNGERFFDAETNACVVKDAEQYYRAMFMSNDQSWNLRDTHMFDTLERLLSHYPGSKAVVWAHNSHLGDARSTGMGMNRNELNVGQLCKEKYGDSASIICFGTHKGRVAAANNWDEDMQIMDVMPSLKESYERLMYNTGVPNFMLDLREKKSNEALRRALCEPRLERFIGVVYRPKTERWSHYSQAIFPKQMDCYVFFAETNAVHHFKHDHHTYHEAPAIEETYPFGV